MPPVTINNPILNSPFAEPTRHFRFDEDGITSEIADGRRRSTYFIPIAKPKTKGGAQLTLPGDWVGERMTDNDFEALPGPGAVQGVVPAAVGLPGVVVAAAARAAGDDTTDRAELHPRGVDRLAGAVYSLAVLRLRDHVSPNPHRIRDMDRWSIPAGQLEASFARAAVLPREIERKERALGRKVQTLAKGLADLMQPGKSLHRRGVGLHAFPVDGVPCLAAGYLEAERDGYRYRYAVLCGGEAAKTGACHCVPRPWGLTACE